MSDKLRPIQQSLPMQLLRARETAMAQFRPMLREHELTEQQWRVIRVLASQAQIDAGELAERCFLLAPSLSRILQTLEVDDLIRRSADPEDQRRWLISLTAKGKRKYASVSPDSEALYQTIEQRFGRDKLKKLYQLLDELNATLAVDLAE